MKINKPFTNGKHIMTPLFSVKAIAAVSLVLVLSAQLLSADISMVPRIETGLVANAGDDNGDGTAAAYLVINGILYKGIFLHADAGLQSQFRSFVRASMEAGAGYLYTYKFLLVPSWIGGGTAITGLWSRFIARPYFCAGTGTHFMVAPGAAIGLDGAFMVYGKGMYGRRLGIGVFLLFGK
jgi:hypothetical protein